MLCYNSIDALERTDKVYLKNVLFETTGVFG